MLNTNSFLAIDFGAGCLKLAEFEQNEAGGLRLKQYGVKSLGIEGSQEAAREAVILKALTELLGEKSYGARQVNACAPGFHVFSKFVKLPPVDASKVTQIIRYEAQQNVPFPLDEVVWDYQILGTSATSELEVLLVAVKSEVVEGLFRVAESAGLRMKLVDASSAALNNSFRYNYGDLEGCTMLLDIGAKTSNLLFFEKGKTYARSINIGANSITQDFANEAKLKFAEAEGIKIEKGSVSLGGAYEEPEDPQAAAIAKIARQLMTRLHIQVNQTIQFYRGQQGGSAPQRLFLSGGASIMPYTAQFFAEKLNVQVEYFNPLRNIEIDPSLDLDDLSKYAHCLGEVVGLGLRELAHCPVELNLMPRSSLQRQEFGHKKIYLIASVFSIALVLFAIGRAEVDIAKVWQNKAGELQDPVSKLTQQNQKYQDLVASRDKLKRQADDMKALVEKRYYWIGVLTDLRGVMLQAEEAEKADLTKPENGGTNTDAGIWVEEFIPGMPAGYAAAVQMSGSGAGSGAPSRNYGPSAYELRRRNLAARSGQASSAAPGQAPTVMASGVEVNNLKLLCRSINRGVEANGHLEYSIRQLLTNCPTFTGPVVLGLPKVEGDTNTFSFEVTVGLAHPFKL